MKFKQLESVASYSSDRVEVSKLGLENYISTENMLTNKAGVVSASKLPTGKTTSAYQKGDILISNIRPYFKKIWFAENEGGCSNDVLVIRANQGIDSKFLYYVLADDKFFEYDTANSKGTKMPRGDKTAIMRYEIPDLTLDEQRTIAETLSSLDDRIAENKKINHHLAVQSQAIYQKLIATSEKSEAILSDIATITMGQSPKGDTYNNDKIGLPLLNGAADFRGKITPSKWTSDPKKIVKGGEYIFGVRATIGLTTKVFSEYAIGRGTGSALVKNKLYDEFLYFVLKQLFEFFENSGSGTVYVNISKSDFDNYKFDLPPESLIEQFHFTVKPLLDLIYNNNAENERLAKLRDTLLPKLMSGEITVSQVAK